MAQRRSILQYWNKRLGSTTYSVKLDKRFRDAVHLIRSNPHIGRPSTFKGVRVKTIGDYLLFYRIEETVIVIAALWDSRRDPQRMKLS